jgi:hypothetical protein
MSTHIFRKTGYLFSVWDGAAAGGIRKCARHGEFGSSDKYMHAAVGVADHERLWKGMEPKLQVPPYVMSTAINNYAYGNDEAMKYFKDLHSLSRLMLRRSGIGVSHMNIPDLISKMSSLNIDLARPRDDLKMAMEGISDDQQSSIMIHFNLMQAHIEDQTSVKPTARSTHTVRHLVMVHPVTPAKIQQNK